ncbi:BLUF domain-containing protein [Tsuneonella sp. HG222]
MAIFAVASKCNQHLRSLVWGAFKDPWTVTMALFGLLYASQSLVWGAEADAAVENIVSVSRRRNEIANVSGCLLFAGGRFAQSLEGDQALVEEIMASISRDPRHTNICILKQGRLSKRRFSGWALGYAGPSLFIGRSIKQPVLEALRGSERGIADLLSIMKSFRTEDRLSMSEE